MGVYVGGTPISLRGWARGTMLIFFFFPTIKAFLDVVRASFSKFFTRLFSPPGAWALKNEKGEEKRGSRGEPNAKAPTGIHNLAPPGPGPRIPNPPASRGDPTALFRSRMTAHHPASKHTTKKTTQNFPYFIAENQYKKGRPKKKEKEGGGYPRGPALAPL